MVIDTREVSEKQQIVEEILGDVDYFEASDGGPNGPWDFGFLTVRRRENVVYVDDVDGRRLDRFHIDEITPQNEFAAIEAQLRGRLEIASEAVAREL